MAAYHATPGIIIKPDARSTTLSCQLRHQTPPHARVDDAANPERRYDPAHPRKRTDGPIPPHDGPPVRPRDGATAPVVEIQPQQVQRRAQDLDRGRGQELRHRLPAHGPLHLARQLLAQHGAQQGRHVERGEDGQAVARREEGVRRARDGGGRRTARAEEAREALVLVDAQGHVGGTAEGELRGARGHGLGGSVVQRRGGRVDRVGGHVGAAVKEEDEGEGAGEERRVRVSQQVCEGVLETFGQGAAAGRVFRYCAASRACQLGFISVRLDRREILPTGQ
jgi:hypothetical protein